ncbi:MAG: hypothetical protein EXR58_08340 [Chloroflexi bacterium]|nr:hypothetical protein [Chloroflexota bacterium]
MPKSLENRRLRRTRCPGFGLPAGFQLPALTGRLTIHEKYGMDIASIVRSVERAFKLYPADHLWLNPDCGFGTFSNRPVNTSQLAFEKLQAIVAAAAQLRAQPRS